jgi:hypothetical protein
VKSLWSVREQFIGAWAQHFPGAQELKKFVVSAGGASMAHSHPVAAAKKVCGQCGDYVIFDPPYAH